MPKEVFIQILKLLELKDILLKIMPLNKRFKTIVKQHNYVLFKHFLAFMNLGDKLKRSSIPAYSSVFQLMKENLSSGVQR